MKISSNEMYEAVRHKDPIYDGLFFVAVKATSIFCRPICSTAKNLMGSIEFFFFLDQAIESGYHACKVCKPSNRYSDIPDYIENILIEIRINAKNIQDSDLIQNKIEPNKVRRWFKKYHHMTFHEYQRAFRINKAYFEIIQGNSSLISSLNQGYESISGFNSAYKKITGSNPSKSNTMKIINAIRLSTPIGQMRVCASHKGICSLEFVGRKMAETDLTILKGRFKKTIIYSPHPYFDVLNLQLKEYFNGNRRVFDLPLDTSNLEAQKKILQSIVDIPYGETRSYKQQSERLQNQYTSHAIAHITRMNYLHIVIPCHRLTNIHGDFPGCRFLSLRRNWLNSFEKECIPIQ